MFTLTADAIDTAALRREYNRHTAGALVVFEGIVRDINRSRPVVRLEYEATQALAVAEYELIVQDFSREFPLIWTRCVHRIGIVYPGETAIWLAVATGHRADAFTACHRMIDAIKQRLPIWKKEIYPDGESDWINAP